jgi:hypothetical protein
MQHLDASGARPSYIWDARFLKVNNVQYDVEYKVYSLADVQLHGAYVEMIISPSSRCSQFIQPGKCPMQL